MKGNTKIAEFRHLLECFRADSDRWIPWLPVVFGGGIALYFTLLSEPPLWVAFASSITLFAFFLLAQRRDFLFFTLGILFVAALGFATAQFRTVASIAPVIEKRIGPVSLEGQVIRVEHFENGVRLLLDHPRISGLPAHATPGKVRIRIRGKQIDVEAGAWIRSKAVLMPPPAPAAPGSFDYQRKLFFEGIGAIGYGLGAPKTLKAAEGDFASLAIWLEKLRNAVTAKIMLRLPSQTGAIAAALITGDRSGLNEETLENIRKAGLAHLLAISGLHIGLVAGGLFIAIRGGASLIPALALNWPIKKWAAIGAILGALGYALLAGASIPTQRAFLMTGIALLGVLIDRETISLRTLAWVAMTILAIHPESILGPSFQMSFAAVTALVTFYQFWRERRLHNGMEKGEKGFISKLGFYFSGVIATTLIASFATAPFALYHFGQVATFGVIANLLAVPLAAFWIMPWAVISILFMPIGLEGPPLILMSLGLELLQAITAKMGALPNAMFTLSVFPTSALVILVVGGLFVCLGNTLLRKTGMGIITCALSVIYFSPKPFLLIENTGKHTAFLTDQEKPQLVSGENFSSRSGKAWLKRAGYRPLEKAEEKESPVRCDRLACIAQTEGMTVAYVFNQAALLEECHWADILISSIPIMQKCPVPKVVIDRFDLWRNGAYALYNNSGTIKVLSDRTDRGNRPWVLYKKQQKPQ